MSGDQNVQTGLGMMIKMCKLLSHKLCFCGMKCRKDMVTLLLMAVPMLQVADDDDDNDNDFYDNDDDDNGAGVR